MNLPSSVRLVEVAPRDGLQNEPAVVPTPAKIEFVNRLSAAGLPVVEATSFVSPKWVPQFADAADLMAGIRRSPGTRYPVLVPNLKGLEAAVCAGVEEIAVFGAASESFSRKNINCSISESLARFQDVVEAAKAQGIRVRGYISCVLGCPYDGEISQAVVANIAAALVEMGCFEVSLGDTIGVGTPTRVQALVETVSQVVSHERIAVHFHDTYGQALANILAAMERGISVVDCATAGLGGCPFAEGAQGKVATEDVLYMLDGMGIETGVDLDAVIDAGRFICEVLGRPPRSRVSLARGMRAG